MVIKFLSVFLLAARFSWAQVISLEEISTKVNSSLPERYDSITKLQKTTVDNNNFIYNFIVDTDQSEFTPAFPKVKQQILSKVCSKPREKNLLIVQKAHLVYRYENVKGQSLGEFMIRPEHCARK